MQKLEQGGVFTRELVEPEGGRSIYFDVTLDGIAYVLTVTSKNRYEGYDIKHKSDGSWEIIIDRSDQKFRMVAFNPVIQDTPPTNGWIFSEGYEHLQDYINLVS